MILKHNNLTVNSSEHILKRKRTARNIKLFFFSVINVSNSIDIIDQNELIIMSMLLRANIFSMTEEKYKSINTK